MHTCKPLAVKEYIKSIPVNLKQKHYPVKMTVYTVEEVAKMFKVSRDTIERAIKKNQLSACKIGGWRITEEQLQDYINSRTTKRKEYPAFHQ